MAGGTQTRGFCVAHRPRTFNSHPCTISSHPSTSRGQPVQLENHDHSTNFGPGWSVSVTHRSHTPLRLTVALALPLAGALALAGCGSTPPAEVIAGDGVLCDITQRLAADDLRVRCLLQPGDDPHQFRLTPQQSRDLSQAQLVLINGYGLTPSLAEQSKAVAVAERAVPGSPELKVLQDSQGDHQEEGHAAGHAHADLHDHGDRDPHVWHDPGQASAMVQLVAKQLEQLKPAASPRITARARAMTTVLGQLDRWNRQQFSTIPVARPLTSGHRAFASLARAYGLQELPLVDSMKQRQPAAPGLPGRGAAAQAGAGSDAVQRTTAAQQGPAAHQLPQRRSPFSRALGGRRPGSSGRWLRQQPGGHPQRQHLPDRERPSGPL